MKKILFIVPYPLGISPGQRFRFEQYIQILEGENFSVEISPFFKSTTIVKKNAIALTQIISGFFIRFVLLFKVSKVDFVFIFREAAPIGPPFFEWIIAKVLHKKIIYDFDDAIWLADNSKESRIEKMFRWRSKVSSICRWSYKVSAGNKYLANYAKDFNSNVVINPTTIDTENTHNPLLHLKSNQNGRIIIGWTGSYSTLKYLRLVEDVLQYIEKRYSNVEVWVIADRPPDLKIERLKFKPWSVDTEVSDLAQFDIGIMPLPDDEWSNGKCGFKILQYMALAVPSIASPVGVNSEIINPGENGFLAERKIEWIQNLELLVTDSVLRKKLGSNGLLTVRDRFSVLSNKSNFISLLS